MITRETIGGRAATVVYLADGFEPSNPESATLIKIIFDDGEVVFAPVPATAGTGGGTEEG